MRILLVVSQPRQSLHRSTWVPRYPNAPHGHHLEDSLIKLQGLCDFAEEFGDSFHRIEAVSNAGSDLVVLDLKDNKVRDALKAGNKTPALVGRALSPLTRCVGRCSSVIRSP